MTNSSSLSSCDQVCNHTINHISFTTSSNEISRIFTTMIPQIPTDINQNNLQDWQFVDDNFKIKESTESKKTNISNDDDYAIQTLKAVNETFKQNSLKNNNLVKNRQASYYEKNREIILKKSKERREIKRRKKLLQQFADNAVIFRDIHTWSSPVISTSAQSSSPPSSVSLETDRSADALTLKRKRNTDESEKNEEPVNSSFNNQSPLFCATSNSSSPTFSSHPTELREITEITPEVPLSYPSPHSLWSPFLLRSPFSLSELEHYSELDENQ